MPVIEITRKGVYDANGKMMLPGTRVEKPKMPPAWKNKARIVPDAEAGDKPVQEEAMRVLTADNSTEFEAPASDPDPLPESVTVATPDEPDPIDALRRDYEELTGKIADRRWSAARLEREIESIIESGQ